MVPEVALQIAWRPCAKSRGRLGFSSPSSQSGSTKCNFVARPGVQLFTNLPMDSKQNSWKQGLCWFYRKYSSKITATTSASLPSPRHSADKAPSPAHWALTKLHQNKLELQVNSHCSCHSSHSSLKGEGKIWHQTQGCNRHFCPVSRNISLDSFSATSVSCESKNLHEK